MYLHRYTKNNKKPIWKYENMHLCKLSLTQFNFLRQPWILYSFSTLQSCQNSSRDKLVIFSIRNTLQKFATQTQHDAFQFFASILNSFIIYYHPEYTKLWQKKIGYFFNYEHCVYEFYLRWLQKSLVNLLMVCLNINTTMTLFVGYQFWVP